VAPKIKSLYAPQARYSSPAAPPRDRPQIIQEEISGRVSAAGGDHACSSRASLQPEWTLPRVVGMAKTKREAGPNAPFSEDRSTIAIVRFLATRAYRGESGIGPVKFAPRRENKGLRPSAEKFQRQSRVQGQFSGSKAARLPAVFAAIGGLPHLRGGKLTQRRL